MKLIYKYNFSGETTLLISLYKKEKKQESILSALKIDTTDPAFIFFMERLKWTPPKELSHGTPKET